MGLPDEEEVRVAGDDERPEGRDFPAARGAAA
jgi:hypothetical protein